MFGDYLKKKKRKKVSEERWKRGKEKRGESDGV
jgi:hypothetical protein